LRRFPDVSSVQFVDHHLRAGPHDSRGPCGCRSGWCHVDRQPVSRRDLEHIDATLMENVSPRLAALRVDRLEPVSTVSAPAGADRISSAAEYGPVPPPRSMSVGGTPRTGQGWDRASVSGRDTSTAGEGQGPSLIELLGDSRRLTSSTRRAHGGSPTTPLPTPPRRSESVPCPRTIEQLVG